MNFNFDMPEPSVPPPLPVWHRLAVIERRTARLMPKNRRRDSTTKFRGGRMNNDWAICRSRFSADEAHEEYLLYAFDDDGFVLLERDEEEIKLWLEYLIGPPDAWRTESATEGYLDPYINVGIRRLMTEPSAVQLS